MGDIAELLLDIGGEIFHRDAHDASIVRNRDGDIGVVDDQRLFINLVVARDDGARFVIREGGYRENKQSQERGNRGFHQLQFYACARDGQEVLEMDWRGCGGVVHNARPTPQMRNPC